MWSEPNLEFTTFIIVNLKALYKVLRDCNKEIIDSIRLTVRTKELNYTIGNSRLYIYLVVA
jgi:hypothetical protein